MSEASAEFERRGIPTVRLKEVMHSPRQGVDAGCYRVNRSVAIEKEMLSEGNTNGKRNTVM